MAEQKENRFSGMTREEIILEAKKQILHSAVLALAALIVIGVACYAWFVSSGTVTAITGPVTLDLDCFELASIGTAGEYYKLVPEALRNPGYDWNSNGTQTKRNTDISDKNQSILWNMTSDNNLGNFSQADNGIQPGDYGTLEFYVLRKQQGDLKINCYLDIIPLDENGKELVSTTEQNTTEAGTGEAADVTRVLQLLRGHLLFFSTYQISAEGEQVNKTMRQLADISDGSFQVELPADMDKVKVTLNWYWPYFLRHAIEYYQDSTFAEKMSERVVDSLAEGNVNYFFTNDATMVYVGNERKDENDTRTVITKQNVTRYAKRLGEYYNEADQVIGDNVKGIVLCLRAEAG